MKLHRAPVLLVLALAACGGSTQTGVPRANQPQTTRIGSGGIGQPFLYEFVTTPSSRVLVDAAPVTAERAWAALPGIYQEFGLQITQVDSARHLLVSQAHIPRGRQIMGRRLSDVVQCGRTPAGTPAADSYDVTLAVYTALIPQGSTSTTVQNLVEGRAKDPVSNNPAVNCTSTERLERAIADELVARTRG